MSRLRVLLGSTDRKLVATLLLLLLVLAGAVLWAGAVVTRQYVEEVEQGLQRELAAHLVAEEPLFDSGEIDPDALYHVFHTLMVLNPRNECYLTEPTGRLLAWNAPEGSVRLERVDLEPIRKFLAGERLPLRGDDPRHPEETKIFSVAPIPGEDDGAIAGYLYIVLAGELYASVADRLASSYILREGLTLTVAVLAATALLGILLFRLLTRRLRRLDRRIRRFGDDGFAPPSLDREDRSLVPDEIDRLGDTFDLMAHRMSEHVERVERADRLRRELVTNVSHDLRTPVATLRGYLETLLLKHDTLDEEERRRYLEIAHAQSERLGRLVEELFELARLDSGDIELERETFSLSELVQDVASKFALRATERGVDLETRLSRDAPPVTGDLRLLERTLENLIENALRHTEAGGRVRVSVESGEERVRVSVEDTGHGIPEDELPRIFDRFFQGQRDPGRADGGTGLGLAIARRVLELHDSRIEVSSREGEGSRFSFALAVV